MMMKHLIYKLHLKIGNLILYLRFSFYTGLGKTISLIYLILFFFIKFYKKGLCYL